MEDVRLSGTGFTPEEVPAFVFEARLQDGRDFDGKFQVQFALARNEDGEVRFVLADDAGVLGAVPERDTNRVIDSLLDKREHLICINYENTTWSPAPNFVEVPVLGRVVGAEYDWTETYQLGAESVAALREMRTKLKELGEW